MSITRDEWLAELERVMAHRSSSDGLTSQELADRWGVCRRVALERLNRLRDRVSVGRTAHTGIDGRTTMIACYSLKPGVTKRAAKRR
jgi:hypothetical protein